MDILVSNYFLGRKHVEETLGRYFERVARNFKHCRRNEVDLESGMDKKKAS